MKSIGGTLALLCSPALFAQDAEDFFLDNAPTVLTATRLKQPLASAPAAITVIDKAMIEASGAKEIVELFRLVPGMQVGYRYGYLAAVTYHGMSDELARGMQVLVDGHSIYNATFGGVAWHDYPLLIEDIERIEVIRGPNAATYGPNSFLGVINIITTHTSHDQGIKSSFRGGSGDYYRGMARYGGTWNDLSYRISFRHQQDDGLGESFDDSRVDTLSTRFDYRLGKQDVLQYNFGYSDAKSGLGEQTNLADPERLSPLTTLSQNFRWTHLIDAHEQLILRLTHTRREKTENFVSSGKAIDNYSLSERLDFELQHISRPFTQVRMMWGIGSRLDRMRLPLWIGSDDDKTNMLYRFFGNLEWTFLDDFVLNVGALLEKNSYTEPDFSPRVALNYLWSPHHSFRAMFSRASRMPSLGEQNLAVGDSINSIISTRAITDRTLKPVEVYTFEVGHHGQFLNDKLITDIKLAHQRFRRLTQFINITSDPLTGEPILHYASRDVASSLNFETQIDYKPDRQTLLHLGYSWINIDHDDEPIDYAASVPHHSANALASYQFPQGWQASLGYYYRGAMQYLRTPGPIDVYQRLDLVVRKSFKLSEHQSLNFALIHRNNLGSKDEFIEGNRLSDRTFFEISYRFI